MIGRTYLERGHPVVVLVRWAPGGRPRNVLIRRESGELVVRPFRGLRRPPPPPPTEEQMEKARKWADDTRRAFGWDRADNDQGAVASSE